MIGRVFHRWTVLSEHPIRQSRCKLYLCRCECGTERAVLGGNLRTGISKSCGCYKLEEAKERRYRHGRNGYDPTYGSWSAMRARCRNPKNGKFPVYGGRGINVCDRWNSFELFLADMGERPAGMTLDRIDNDRGYEPANCRWATTKTQMNNRSVTRIVEAFGHKKSITDWANEYQLPFLVVWKRLKRGWPIEKALTTALKQEVSV